jgi:hypothetical protein
MILIFFFILAVFSPGLVGASILYVSPSGTGGANNCQNFGDPCSLTQVQTVWVAGDTIKFFDGNYGTTGIGADTSPSGPPNNTILEPVTSSATVIIYKLQIRGRSGVTVRSSSATGTRNFIVDGRNHVQWVDGSEGGIFIESGTSLRFENITTRNSQQGFLADGNSLEFININSHGHGMAANGSDITCDVSFTLDGDTPARCHGIYMQSGSTITIDGGEWHHNDGYGIHAASSALANVTIKNVKAYSNSLGFGKPNVEGGVGGHSPGIALHSSLSLGSQGTHRIYNNLVYSNGYGIWISSATGNAFVDNNTVISNADLGIINNSSNASTNTARNNLVISNAGGSFDWTSGSAGSSNITTGTLASHFADAANRDYRLCTASGAPHVNCVGASTAVNYVNAVSIAEVTTDIVGTTRPSGAYDVGAYESGPTVPVVVPDPILVAEISCDNTVVDSSTQANHGTLTNGATYDAGGKYNAACSFDGTNDYVSIANSTTLDQLTHGFTISAWVKPSATMTTLKYVATNDGASFLGASSGGICGAGGVFGGYSQADSAVNACHSTPLTTDWTHLAVTYNSQAQTPQVLFYRNGVSTSSAVGSALLDAVSGPLRIGSGVDEAYFAGLIDEIRVYNYARTAAQVLTDMNTPINASVPNTVTVRMASTTLKMAGTVVKFGSTTAATPSYILLENGDNLLLEDGDDMLSQQ